MDAAGLSAGFEAWHWLAIGLLLLIAELATGSTYLLWLAIASWIVGLLALVVPLPLTAELLIFSVSALGLTWFGRTRLKGRWLEGGDPALNAPRDALVGQVAIVEQAFAEGVGRVRHGDTVWRATSPDALAVGEAVEILACEGATLAVRRRSA